MLVGRYVPTMVILVHHKDKPWFVDQCRRAFVVQPEPHFGGPMIALLNREEFTRCPMRANKTYSEAKCQFCERNRDALANSLFPHN